MQTCKLTCRVYVGRQTRQTREASSSGPASAPTLASRMGFPAPYQVVTVVTVTSHGFEATNDPVRMVPDWSVTV